MDLQIRPGEAGDLNRLVEIYNYYVAEADDDSPGSVALHEKPGFKRVGSYHEVGFKFDKFWDVDWFEKDVSAA